MHMATKSVQIRLDAKQKKRVEEILERIGMDVPTAVRVFFAKVVATGGIPFMLNEWMEDQYTPEQISYLDRLAAEAKSGKGLSPPFDTAEEAIRYLHEQVE